MAKVDKGTEHVEALGRKIQAEKTVRGGFKAFVDQTIEDGLEIVDELERGDISFDDARAVLRNLKTLVPGISQSIVVGTKAEGE